ncbi:hypothetical protein [Amycolatopsis alkalitolerans]|uniref:Uncharacterized protein n=1 Tax=Amycolatopsis alkalitolerans TaxID=2547244 RepID=A0A5C4LRU8_9PSEU|nr:hypothetical protein [Amycolatopsis alkalitolerans]TNC20307.1 hypothetical protein FG385_31095 [Amycolatopsis alkalitolerans]
MSQRTAERSAHQGARDQLAAYQGADTRKDTAVHEDGLPRPGYWTQDNSDSTVRLLCGNVVASLEMQGVSADRNALVQITEKAVSDLTEQVPGLC